MFQKIQSFLFENTSDKQTILKNTFWLMLSEFISKGSMFLITILIARILGPNEFGMLSFVMSFVAMFVVVTDFGLTTLMVREVSRDSRLLPSYLVNLSFLKIILGIVTFLLVLIAASFLGKESLYFQLILIYAGYSILNNIGEFSRAFFRPSESMQYEAFLKSINGGLMLFIVGGVLFWKGDLVSIMYGYLIAGAVSLCISLMYVGKSFVVKNIKFQRNLLLQSLKSGLFLLWSLVFIQIYVVSDKVILGLFGYETQLGFYSSAVSLISIFTLAFGLFYNSLIPKISKYFHEDRIKFQKFMIAVNKVTLYYLTPILVFGLLFPVHTLNFFYGLEYTSASFVFQILILNAAIIYISVCYGNALQICNREKIYMYGVSLGAIINIVGNIIFIPKYGMNAAALTTLLAEIIVFVFMFTEFNLVLAKVQFWNYLTKPLLMGAILSLFYFASFLPFIILILLFAGAYFVLIVQLGILKEFKSLQ